ncbi:MarR family winged helix-turn-helix transcriptional regulator [Flavivirga eckloniae]|uniref:HTH marR-type domain-containing protein n=1 Tax=Flavivirga eckloniae TaxID=1803846 RepID=A0A2K9PNJ5_9FLAO|nr:MarR family winged helix-turn-helix transcriptional regulator [Flavivirga eckloniae]AUP78624.1 hypothetical protein C1H87_07845 [Flavivirga eckloniae]
MDFELQQCVGARLRRLSRQTDHLFRKCLKGYDISENQMTLLFALHVSGKIEQGLLGKELVIDKSSMSRNMSLLSKKGYIIKSNDYHPQVELSKKGEDIVLKLIPLWKQTMDTIYEKLGDEGMEMIENIESKLI